ncbi:MAG: translation initiation factor IF-2 subunit beta [Candidatus Aenigmarchaeota archaeon]|nr:translation initiation factor IF-2 subunit beta [Candidatus Aenigmarchaeota archaeon]
MEYEKLLNKAYEKMPKIEKTVDRLEVPDPEIIIQGRQTIIRNFSQICEIIRRDPNHLLKFLTKELATPGGFDGTRATMQSKIYRKLIENKMKAYVRDYVICKECGKPDTKLVKENRIDFLKCEACGAKSPVKSIK